MELRQALDTSDVADIRVQDRGAQPGGAAAGPGDLRAGPGGGDLRRADGRRPGSADEVVEDADYEVIDEDEAAKTS